MESFGWIFGFMGFSLGAGALAGVNQLTTQVKALEQRIALLEAEPDSQKESFGSSE